MGAHRHVLLLVTANGEATGWRTACPEHGEMDLPGLRLPAAGNRFHRVRRELSDGQKRTGHVG
ncbi:hypothetical protein Mesau_02594 [Mesorhizobium australicum WSM2073]|uniref:Uncharacterized protein n=1 Tax=Mesorhizobium australicum (strain HAMBI 3006 / LMG 24608 / WSM2073) TaxID=754035 RepID=L0KKD0_MESAW|nr:hypothetical protein Mesau_02594 [Mesorhizobium australicum WSM2073]